MTLHPATRLAAWILLAVTMPWLSWHALAWMVIVVVPACFCLRGVAWRRYLRRSSVLLFSMLLIYAFATPGRALIPAWVGSPTYEGAEAGMLQATRLILLLLTLAILLAQLNREELLAGVYTLLRPFRILGLPIERLALRLWLTLHYADAVPASGPLQTRLDRVAELAPGGPSEFVLAVPPFRVPDAVFGVCVLAGLAWVVV